MSHGRPTVVHSAIRGRLRVRIAGLRRSEAIGRALVRDLTSADGVRCASVNHWTGGLLVEFDETIDHVTVIALIEESWDSAARSAQPTPRAEPPRSRSRQTAERQRRAGVLEVLRRAVIRTPYGGDRGPGRTTDAHNANRDRQPEAAWHVVPAGEVASRLGVDLQSGLEPEEARRRLARWGPNRLAEIRSRSVLQILGGQLANLPAVLLIASAALSVVIGGVGDAVAILAVVVLNAAIGTFTETQAEQTIGTLTQLAEAEIPVLRSGREVQVSASEVAVGDLLRLRRGMWIPVDARLVETNRLTADESSLTGEAVPVTKEPDPLVERDTPLGDRRNMVFRGTLVTGGSGIGVAVATGSATEIGRIQTLVAGERTPRTPVQRQLDRLGRELVALSTAVSAGIFLISLVRGHRLLEVLRTTVSLAVAALPEGLPAVATSTLAHGVRTLRREGVIVRRLVAVETFGSVEVLCLDKTGTITTNRMEVVCALSGGRRYDTSAGPLQAVDSSPDTDELRQLLKAAALCSEADLVDGEIVGSSTEAALIRAAGSTAGLDIVALREELPRTRLEHRAESRTFMLSEHRQRGADESNRLIAVKGRPDEILDLARWQVVAGERRELCDSERVAIQDENERMSGQALRVLGVAYREAPAGASAEELTWLGLIGLADPPREGMDALIERFRQAGIRTQMMTGDQSATATAVAREIGLSGAQNLESLDSVAVDQIDPDLLAALAKRTHVFSRVSPSHKLQIVRALQADGTVVAMTGDGINDGPALKAADVGIAMGGGRTELAREVADVVLVDDRLESVLATVAHGRTAQENIRKAVHFITSTNLSEVLFTFTSVALGMGLPFGPKQLLWINILSDVLPEIALAVDVSREETLQRPPDDPDQPIVAGEEYRRIAAESGVMTASAMASYAYARLRYGPGAKADTVAFLSLVGAQLLHTLSARSPDEAATRSGGRESANPLIPLAVGGGLGVQVVGEMFSTLRRVMGTTRIGLVDGVIASASALASFVAIEGLKTVRTSTAERERGTA